MIGNIQHRYRIELRERIPTLEKTIAFVDLSDNIGDINIVWTYGWTE